VPEVARSLPEVSRDGLRYRFTIRRGYRFSPPSNAPVTAAAFKRAIERSADPVWHDTGAPPFYFTDIVGAAAFRARRARHLSGVTAVGNRLTIRLSRPAPDLPLRLSMSFFCAVPPDDAPARAGGIPDLPTAGPYYVRSVTGDRQIVLARNPNYRGPRKAHLDAIDIRIGRPRSGAIARVVAGTDDYYTHTFTGAEQADLRRRFGPSRGAAQRFFSNPNGGVVYFVLNTSRPTFASERLRRAVGFAIDRRALLAQPTAGAFGPGVPFNQDLAPSTPGYRDAAIYPLDGPDVARARALAGRRQHHAVMLTCDTSPCPQWGAIVRRDLAGIGIDVRVERLPLQPLFDRQTKRNDWDIGWWNWGPDFPDASGVLNLLFSGDHNRRLAEAAALTGRARYAAYARLDADLTGRAAPMIPYGIALTQDLFSARMGCQIFHPVYFMDLAALCIKSR
jgi:peptide/nickel transport system substrate-binding protein